jgi:hypothetical protein
MRERTSWAGTYKEAILRESGCQVTCDAIFDSEAGKQTDKTYLADARVNVTLRLGRHGYR